MEATRTDTPETRRALASPVRARLYEALADADGPRDIDDLVEASGLHANTVRWHLGRLVDARLVRAETSPSGGRGRPRTLYHATPPADSAEEYRVLATALADALAGAPDGAARAAAAGAETGRRLMSGRAPAPEAVQRVTRFLDRQGFEPSSDGESVWMHRCPFLDVVLRDDAHKAVVCGLHHGLVSGALEAMGGTAEVVEFTPFKTPHACLVRLAPANAS
jgi:predicted ArsR family transcriptional regulator